MSSYENIYEVLNGGAHEHSGVGAFVVKRRRSSRCPRPWGRMCVRR